MKHLAAILGGHVIMGNDIPASMGSESKATTSP